MLHGAKMFCGVLVFRGVATAHVAAAQTQAEMNPGVAHLEAFFTALGLWFDGPDLIEVRARFDHVVLLGT
jgi:hypothetical protein